MLCAHYHGSKARGFKLTISNGPSPILPNIVAEYPVKDKREARKLAVTLNAKPWNF